VGTRRRRLVSHAAARPAAAAGRTYEHWVAALHKVVRSRGLLEEGYVNPEEREESRETGAPES